METVAEYIRDFELMSASMTRLPNAVLESTFVMGLKPDIRVEVRVLKPVGLGQLMETAQLVEEKNIAIKANQEPTRLKSNRPNSFRGSGVKPSGVNYKPSMFGARDGYKASESFLTKTVAWGTRSTLPNCEGPQRRLNLAKAELQVRREKALCFHCDEKFSLGHSCKQELHILIVHEDEREEGEVEDT